MKIESLQSVNPVFTSRIVKTRELKNFQCFLSKNSLVGHGRKDYMHHKVAFDEIIKAFRQFPSVAEMTISIRNNSGEPMNARGVVATKYAEFVDTEPANNDIVAPIFNIMKRILHPENKSQLGRLMGESTDNHVITDTWWKKYIEPIWYDVDKYFQESSRFEPEAQIKFNEEFRNL